MDGCERKAEQEYFEARCWRALVAEYRRLDALAARPGPALDDEAILAAVQRVLAATATSAPVTGWLAWGPVAPDAVLRGLDVAGDGTTELSYDVLVRAEVQAGYGVDEMRASEVRRG